MAGATKVMTYARTWVNGLSLRAFLLLIGAMILLVSGLFGGMRRATPESTVVELVAGKTHQADPLAVTVERTRWTNDLGSAGKTERGRFLIVIAKIRTDEKLSIGSDVTSQILRLRGLQGIYGLTGDKTGPSADARPQVYAVDDSTRISTVPAGLTFEVAFVWEQSLAEPLPKSLTVEARRLTWRQSSIDQQYAWFDPTVDAVGTFPLQESDS